MNSKRVFNKALTTISVGIGMTLALAGCGQSSQQAGSNTGGTTTNLKPVDLTWYYPVPAQQPDQQQVEDAVNKITKAKINATVHLKPIDFGDYETKMNTIAASGQNFDLAWTSNWLFNYQQNVAKGAFQPIDDILKKYGSDIMSQIPSWMWDDVKITGKIYAVPSYQISAKSEGFVIQKRFIDKYHLDVAKLKKLEDIEPFLATLKKNELDIVPFGMNGGVFDANYNGYWIVGPGSVGSASVASGFVKKGDATNTILNSLPPEYINYLHTIRNWYNTGYINQDAPTIKNFTDQGKTGKYAVGWEWTIKPGGEAEAKLRNGGYDVVYVPLTKPVFTGVTPTMNAISRTSKNPDRAMMLLDLVNTDKELYNLLSFGLEGKDYTKVDANTIKTADKSGYAINENWVFGNVFNGYLQNGQPSDTWDKTKQVNESAERPPYVGFTFDPSPVKAELANINNVNDQYQKQLETGSVDPDKLLPVYEQKLKQAGEEKVVAEVQKQLNDWLQNKKK